MRLLNSVGALGALCTAVAAREMPVDDLVAAELYDSGLVHMELMSMKHATFARQRAHGAYDSTQYKRGAGPIKCVDGFADVIPGDAMNKFKCKNIDYYDFRSHADLGSATGEGSSSWGWTSSDGREFVAIGQADGTAFAEINKAGELVYLGRLPTNSVNSIWREIRGYKNYMIIGSEAEQHFVQIFDMTKLLEINPAKPVVFDKTKDLTGLFKDLPVGRTHNVVVNEEKDYAVAVGAVPRPSGCRAGLIFIDLEDVSKPTTPGCEGRDGYVHDAQCLVYRGPDEEFVGRDICYGYNEDTLTIYDVTDQKNVKIISRTSYDGASYTHQGWVVDTQWQTNLVMNDELDEQEGAGPASDGFPVTFFWDITSLKAPKQTGYFKSSVKSIDHNLYVKDEFVYQSNYGAGLRVLDVRSLAKDPSGKGVTETGFFDIYPEDDSQPGGGLVEFVGSWSSYALFPSGYIFINTIERGGFVVKMQDGALN